MSVQSAFTAPHFKAAQAGQSVLDRGGNACEAMVAAAAMIAVQYPHMNGLGGDGFWLISKPGQAPVAIDACGRASKNIELADYAQQSELPDSGGAAALTMAGTVSGWQKALDYLPGSQSLAELLAPAITAASEGIDVTQSLVNASEKTYSRLSDLASFQRHYLPSGRALKIGDTLTNPNLAATLQQLAERGLDDFYRGELAERMVKGLQAQGSPLTLDDFHAFEAEYCQPLSVEISQGQLYNLPAPTQGVASLTILAIYDQLAQQAKGELDHIHLLVEATKQAFLTRDRYVTDPQAMSVSTQSLLEPQRIARGVDAVDINQALPWPHVAKLGDTIWMGACDSQGVMVSFIQSVYWEFGSGVVAGDTGVLWNCRGKSFSLDANHHNVLAANKKPFHTLNPAYADLRDGRRMVYGTMGGEGQPQTQACLFSRYLYQNFSLEEAISAPRWLLGRTWGSDTHSLRLEQGLFDRYQRELSQRGHQLDQVEDHNELMGHAGAIVLSPQGQSTAATDPRSDGATYLGEHHV